MYRSKKGSTASQRQDSQYSRTRRRKQIREEERRRRQEPVRPEEQDGTPEHDLSSRSAERFAARQARFITRYGRSGSVRHVGAWLVHNCIAHPLLGLKPGATTLRIHDATADWLNLAPVPSASPHPRIERRRDWVLHNCIAHPLMGIAPASALFRLHDTTAEDMRVPGWV